MDDKEEGFFKNLESLDRSDLRRGFEVGRPGRQNHGCRRWRFPFATPKLTVGCSGFSPLPWKRCLVRMFAGGYFSEFGRNNLKFTASNVLFPQNANSDSSDR